MTMRIVDDVDDAIDAPRCRIERESGDVGHEGGVGGTVRPQRRTRRTKVVEDDVASVTELSFKKDASLVDDAVDVEDQNLAREKADDGGSARVDGGEEREQE
jgi:hypothetical protein